MAETIYILSSLMCLLCTVLLLQRWRTSRLGLLFWSGICFLTLTVANILLFVDRIVVPYTMDLALFRHSTTLLAIIFMLFGLIVGRRNG